MILKMLEPYDLTVMGFNSAESVHYMVEAMRRAYIERNHHLGDPDFVDNPIDQLLSSAHINKMRAGIVPGRATPMAELNAHGPAANESSDTTQLAVMDKDGNAVSLTITINGYFGAMRIAGNTGFFLNNEMVTTHPYYTIND